MPISLHQDNKYVQLLAPASRSGAALVAGTGIDTQGYEELLVILNSGVHATGGTNAVKMQESADDSTYSDITSAAFTTVTDSTDANLYVGSLSLRFTKRYVRVAATDAVAAVVSGVVGVLRPRALPASQTNTVAFALRND